MTGKQGGTTTRKPKPPPPPPKRQRGRPSKRSKRLEEEILDWLSEGLPLRAFCRQPGRPAFRTVYDWRAVDPEFSARIAMARAIGFDALSQKAYEEIWGDHAGADGKIDPARVQRARLRAWGTLQLLAKWDPQRYGDRLQLAGDQDSPIRIGTDEEVARQLSLLLTRAAARRAEQENGRDPSESKPRPRVPHVEPEPEPAPEPPQDVLGIPRTWIEDAQARWRVPDERPLVTAAGIALLDDGRAIVVRRSGTLIDEIRGVMQSVAGIREAAGGIVPIGAIGPGARSLAENAAKDGLPITALHATIDRPKLEMTLRSALDPEGGVRLGLPPGSLGEKELLAVAASLSVENGQRWNQPVIRQTPRSQRHERNPFEEM